jgi:DNA-directed RNA polymerase subunit RPC12/RpoP
MAEQERSHRCEVCGAGGTLVQFGDAREYHYHCLACWKQVAEHLAVAYALCAGM